MQENGKVFHQAKAEVWERISIIESLIRIYDKGSADGGVLDKVPTRLDLRMRINDLMNNVLKDLGRSDVFGQSDSSDFPVMTKSYDGEELFKIREELA